MPDGPQIEVVELRAALDRLLTAVESRFGATLDLDADHHWTLDPTRTFDPQADQSQGLMVGQLSDDVQEMRALLQRDPGHVVVWHDLVHVVAILRRIAALDLPDAAPPEE